MKKRILPITILIALLASIVTFVVLLNMEKNMLNDYERGPVWILKEEMPAGTECTAENITRYMEPMQVDKQSIPDKYIEDLNVLAGLRSVITLPKGSILTEAMFTGERDDIAEMDAPVIAGCKAEDLYQLVSGSLRKGDMINLYTVNEEEGQTSLLWENVRVYEVFDSAGKSIAVTDEETAAARINILLEKEYAERFYTELNNGSLRVVKVCETL
ncbi:MAG: SAF domain-containing protein [Lachnospiraceae bacterium]|nr:SAF domain-containing protein [Lachnospiraceae bacterium]